MGFPLSRAGGVRCSTPRWSRKRNHHFGDLVFTLILVLGSRMSLTFQTPAQIVAAHENGLPDWQFNPTMMDALMADRKAVLFAEAAPHLAGIGKGKMA